MLALRRCFAELRGSSAHEATAPVWAHAHTHKRCKTSPKTRFVVAGLFGNCLEARWCPRRTGNGAASSTMMPSIGTSPQLAQLQVGHACCAGRLLCICLMSGSPRTACNAVLSDAHNLTSVMLRASLSGVADLQLHAPDAG